MLHETIGTNKRIRYSSLESERRPPRSIFLQLLILQIIKRQAQQQQEHLQAVFVPSSQSAGETIINNLFGLGTGLNSYFAPSLNVAGEAIVR